MGRLLTRHVIEVDDIGNTNNVIIYDHTEDQHVTSDKTAVVEKEIQLGNQSVPETPESSPFPEIAREAGRGRGRGTGTAVLKATKSESDTTTAAPVSRASDTVASKTPGTTRAPAQKVNTQPTTPTPYVQSKTSFSEPATPAERPSVPAATESLNSSAVPAPEPAARPPQPATEVSNDTQDTRDQRRALFARIIRLITDFFRKWFTG